MSIRGLVRDIGFALGLSRLLYSVQSFSQDGHIPFGGATL